MTSTATTVVVLLALLWPWWRLLARRPDVAVALLVAVAVFSTWALELVFRAGVPAEVVRGLIPVKDGLAVVAVAALLLRRRPDGQVAWRAGRAVVVPLVLGLGVLGLRTVIDTVGIGPSISLVFAVRAMLDPLLGLALGLLLLGEERRRMLRLVGTFVSVGAALALVEYVLPARWWLTDVLGVGPFWTQVKQLGFFLWDFPGVGPLPGNFYTGLLGEGVRRLSGPFGEPLGAGYLLGIGAVAVAWTTTGRRRWLQLALVLAALLLTFTRAGWLIAAAGIAPLLVSWVWVRPPRQRWTAIAGIAVVATAALVVVAPLRRYLLSVVDGSNGSTAAHLEALEALDQHPYTPLGDGLGQIGSIVDAGTESTLATLVLQLGLVLGVLYVGATLWLLWAARRSWRGTVPRAAYVLLLLALGLSWFTSEQWMTFNSGLTFAVVLGVGVTTSAVAARPAVAEPEEATAAP